MAKYDTMKNVRKLSVSTYILLSLIPLSSFAQSSGQVSAKTIQEAIITDPSISRRCEALIDKRKQKITHRQRLTYLSQRNLKLQKITPKVKVSIKDKLISNQESIIKELRLTNLQIQDLEENIIRRGCPGISL